MDRPEPTFDVSFDATMLIGDVLAHHGVVGMKWGVHKSGGHSIPVSDDHVIVENHKATIAAGGLKALSNHQLRAVNERMQLEQTHRDLTAKAPGKFGEGHKTVKEVLKVAKTANDIHSTLNGPAGKAARKIIKKKLG